MQSLWILPSIFLGLIVLTAQPNQAQQAVCKSLAVGVKTCSFTGLNGSCTVYIDRMHPIAPPTIYARRGSKITVDVINPSPFETQSLDLKTSTDSTPPDLYSEAFNEQSTNINKLQLDLLTGNFLSISSAKHLTNDQKTFATMQRKLKADAVSQANYYEFGRWLKA